MMKFGGSINTFLGTLLYLLSFMSNMNRWFIVLAALLLLAGGVSARYVNPVYQVKQAAVQNAVACRTTLECFTSAKAFNGTCQSGYVIDRQPACRNQLCNLCKPDQMRLRIVCRYDEDCMSKVKCSNPLNTQCAYNKCSCSAQPRVECKQDHDCVRPLYLAGNFQKMKCDHGKCITPKPSQTLAPQYNIPANVSAYVRPHY
jgi:hypothetical protein